MTEPSRRNAIRRRPSVDAMHRYLPGIMVHVALIAAWYAFVTYGHVPVLCHAVTDCDARDA